MMAEDRVGAEGLDSCRRSPSGGLGDDHLNQLGDLLAVLLRREIPPAGQRRESHELGGRELASAELLTTQSRLPFLGAIEPGPFDRLAGEERSDAMNPPGQS